MADLIQLVYISRATFEPAPASGGVEPHVARILQQSRSNNPRLGLGGVLYYGEGYFFQCLEGDKPVVERLLATLKRDERHRDVTVVLERSIEQRQFSDWSMKYLPTTAAVKRLLSGRGYRGFNPYEFDRATIEALLDTLSQLRAESGAENAPPSSSARAESVPSRNPQAGHWPYVLAGGATLAFAVAAVWVVFA